LVDGSFRGKAVGMQRCRSRYAAQLTASAFAGYRFPAEVILLAVRWYLQFGLSYRDLEEIPGRLLTSQ
jgi:transposase-like protein